MLGVIVRQSSGPRVRHGVQPASMSSKGRDRPDPDRQKWEAVGDSSGERMIRRRQLLAWQRFVLERPDGTEIGRVKANMNGGTKALTVSSRSYAVKRVGFERLSSSLTDATTGRIIGQWRGFGTKDPPSLQERTARRGAPGFTFEGGEDWGFRRYGRRLRSATAQLVDPQGKVVVTMRFLPPWPLWGGETLQGMPQGEAVFAVPSTPDLIAVTALGFEKFHRSLQTMKNEFQGDGGP